MANQMDLKIISTFTAMALCIQLLVQAIIGNVLLHNKLAAPSDLKMLRWSFTMITYRVMLMATTCIGVQSPRSSKGHVYSAMQCKLTPYKLINC